MNGTSLSPEVSRSKVIATIARIAAEHGTCAKSVIQRSRMVEHMAVRRAAIREIYAERRYTVSALGRAFGMDHTTIIHHVNPQFRACRLAKSKERREAKRRASA